MLRMFFFLTLMPMFSAVAGATDLRCSSSARASDYAAQTSPIIQTILDGFSAHKPHAPDGNPDLTFTDHYDWHSSVEAH